MVRMSLKGIAWLLGIGLLAFAVLLGINATDEALSEEAQAALRVPPLPLPSEKNGFIDFLALGAPADAPTYETGLAQLAAIGEQGKRLSVKIDSRIPKCQQDYLNCVATAPVQPSLGGLIDSHEVFVKRYRAMREKPEFVGLSALAGPEDPLPAYIELFDGQRFSLMNAALDFNAGNAVRAIDELEAEFAFYRKVAAGSRTLIQKMIAFALRDRAALFAAELARNMPRREIALWDRLNTLLRAPTSAELDITAAWNQERADTVRWMQTRRYVRLSDGMYDALRSFGDAQSRPWWDPVAPWLYRPHYSVNRYVAKSRLMQAITEQPSKEFLTLLEEYRTRARILEPAGWERLVLSPVGHKHLYLNQYDLSDYVGRGHGHTGVQAIVGLQVRLRAAGIIQPTDVLNALSGPLGSVYVNPFTGKSFEFDPRKMTIGFACEPMYLTAPDRELVGANGRFELPL